VHPHREARCRRASRSLAQDADRIRRVALAEAAIQRSNASLEALSERYGINPTTVTKWRRRTNVDQSMGPKVPWSTALSSDEETLIRAEHATVGRPSTSADCVSPASLTARWFVRSP